MVEIEIDGKKVEVPEGSMVMHAAEKLGTYIPHFCYHKKLSIAANCRMCLVDVEKAPKALPACATPVTQGMVVHTRTSKAVTAQQSVMEFLLINHPLDCPVCDQGGECQLQDLAVGYGSSSSRYEEEKRAVTPKDVGPLISMQEMSRCIQCTRCVRFGQEIAGVMELGMSNRGEHSEIETFVGRSVDSELSGNMIDICPVGALTSKPFRYNARTWELSRRKSVAPHDASGANLIVQVKSGKVMRVVPLENEAINECWIADRDRFSYEALNGDDRLTKPMIKQCGQWQEVDWQTALEHVANGLRDIQSKAGGSAIGLLASPHSTLEELYLAKQLMQGLGSDNIDYRLRASEYATQQGVRWLGMPIAALSELDRVLVVGSNLRKDHPLFAQRIRQAVRAGAQVSALTSAAMLRTSEAWAMPLHAAVVESSTRWAKVLASLAATIATQIGVAQPVEAAPATDELSSVAHSLLTGERKAILLGNAAAHHAHAEDLLAICQWIAEKTGATLGYLTEAANTVGAQFVGVTPGKNGLDAGQMLSTQKLRALLLWNCEPGFDSAPANTDGCELVVTFSPFKANMEISNVLLPIAPFSETSGTFVNAEARVQSFHAVVPPLQQTRPGWKVLRALADVLNIDTVSGDTSQAVLTQIFSGVAPEFLPNESLSNRTAASMQVREATAEQSPVGVYQLDGIVRRAPSLQLTADARGEGQA